MVSLSVSPPYLLLQCPLERLNLGCNHLGLVHEDCVTKMRLMSLVDLGSNESRQISYAIIRDTLQVNHISGTALDMPSAQYSFNI